LVSGDGFECRAPSRRALEIELGGLRTDPLLEVVREDDSEVPLQHQFSAAIRRKSLLLNPAKYRALTAVNFHESAVIKQTL
jgi:hypothetical protein